MQKRSHTLLASNLLRSRGGFGARRFALAFLFGSFQPDCNPLSYLKGSLRARTFHGHHFSNSRPYIYSRILRLQRRRRWTVWQYYTLGKLTHYLADAFTYPHNEHFPDSLLQHRQYEGALRLYLADYLPRHIFCANLCPPQMLLPTLDAMHRQYLTGSASLQRDAHYILTATELLVSGCLPYAGFIKIA